jgi:hypothetical protein
VSGPVYFADGVKVPVLASSCPRSIDRDRLPHGIVAGDFAGGIAITIRAPDGTQLSVELDDDAFDAFAGILADAIERRSAALLGSRRGGGTLQ